MKTVPKETFCP